MGVSTADFAATVPWNGVLNKPDFFPSSLSELDQSGASNGQFIRWNGVTKKWEAVTVAPSSTDWGDIDGTLSDQLDLQGALNAKAIAGPVGSSGLTMATSRLLGRTTASPGAVEEITVGAGLSLSAGALTATAGSFRINVKNFGAVGDGATNDTAAINAAIATMTNYSTLYFPAGKYLVTLGGITAFTSLSNITILGDGWSSQLYSTATAPASGFLVIAASCDNVTIRDFALLGSATSRVSGGHGLIVYSNHTRVSGLFISGTSDFGMYIGSGGALYAREIRVDNCLSDHTQGDGFHFGPVTDSGLYNCTSYYANDDGVGLGDDGGIGFPPIRIEIVGFQSYHANSGTNGAGIRIFDGGTDIHVIGGSIYQSCEAGLTCGRFFTTTAYNTRIKVDGLKVFQCNQNTGMYGQMNFQFCNQLSVTGCWSEAPVTGGCYAFLDCNDVSVIGNTAKDAALRAFVTDDGTTSNVATPWSNWTFSNNVCLGTPTNESYYFVPHSTKRISNLLLNGNTETGQSAANYIATNYLSGTCKIVNNTSLGGKAIVNGGTGSIPTTVNNN